MKAIYKIQNVLTGDVYVGSTADFAYRKWVHLKRLRDGSHHSPILQNSWNKHGESNFAFSVIEEVDCRENLVIREQHYIDKLNPRFNMAKVAGSPLGVKHTAKARLNMSLAHIGNKLSKESIRKRSLAQGGSNHWSFGKSRSEATKKKISDSLSKRYKEGYIHPQTGRSLTESQKTLISKKLMKPVVQKSVEGVVLRVWDGAKQAERELGIRATAIGNCCRKKPKYKTAGGYLWEFTR